MQQLTIAFTYAALQAVNPTTPTEEAVKAELLRYLHDFPANDEIGDMLLSHIEETYQYENYNTDCALLYQDGIDFLTKYNLMP